MSPTSQTEPGTPLVSVIMNCYNGEQYLQEAIESVFAQSYSNWELIVWDNASTDGTRGIALGCARDGRLRYFRAEQNTLLGAARNLAIGCARGTLVAFLDCDDRWLPEKLAEQVALLQARPDVGFLYSNFYFTRPGSERLHLGFKRRQMEGRIFGDLLRYFSINLQTVVLRKSILDQLPELFDVKLNLAEDYDLFLRFLYATNAAYLHRPLVVYRMHASMSSIRFAQKYPDELVYCVTKLKGLYPDMEQTYPREMSYLKGKIAYWRAKAAITDGHPALGRELLAPHRRGSPVFFLLYYASFMPPRLWLRLQDLRYFLR